MNAEEAIEIIEEMIKWRNQPDTMHYLADEAEALEIVLNSAKVFHEHHLPEIIEKTEEVAHPKEWKTLYGYPLDELGIDPKEVNK